MTTITLEYLAKLSSIKTPNRLNIPEDTYLNGHEADANAFQDFCYDYSQVRSLAKDLLRDKNDKETEEKLLGLVNKLRIEY